jgi:ParB family chromosome partitioning protein
MAKKKKGLGRGLGALLGSNAEEYAAVTTVVTDDTATIKPENISNDTVNSDQGMPVDLMVPNTYQPRKFFDVDKAKDLVDSIREKGILQPILVRPLKDTKNFEIIAGERRWRAAQAAGLHEVPVIIREFTDEESLEIALIENIQRHDLTPIEEAMGYKRLMDDFDHTQERLGVSVGKSRSHIANILRLLLLPSAVQEMLSEGKLSMGHARALITADNAVQLALKIVKQGLSVRQTEALVKGDMKEDGEIIVKPKKAVQKFTEKDPDTIALENELSAATGLIVTIDFCEDETGEIRIAYKNLEQLDEICQRLS